MSAKKNIVASVLARLRNHSKSTGAPFQQVLQQYAMERLLYRISKSRHANDVVLKGALLLKTVGVLRARPTMDIDMLCLRKADQTSLLALAKDCIALDVEADGVTFLAESVVAETITKDSECKGIRILMDARMDNVRLKVQIDFGAGDVMVPGPRRIEYPRILDGEAIRLLAYPIESAIAEKLQAMVALGNANSRMKDFYDVWVCSKHLDFDADTLRKAIAATFKNRDTSAPTGELEAFTTRFVATHDVQWQAFVKRIGEHSLADAFGKIVQEIKAFAMLVLLSLSSEERLGKTWLGRDAWVGVTKAKQLRSFLGDEDFFSLLREVDCTRSSKTVSHTIRSRIERFAQTTGIELPPSCFELYDILAEEVFPPHGVLRHEVPDWIHIDSLAGMGPLLASGTCLGWKWEFRARHEHWAIWAAPAHWPNLYGPCPFEYEERYGAGPSDASVMSFEDARYFIVRELTRLAREQGLLEDMGRRA